MVDVAQLSAGEQQFCAVTREGRVWCWGRGFRGELGDGDGTTNRNVPYAAEGVTDAIACTSGMFHTCVVTRRHGVACWGRVMRFSSTPSEGDEAHPVSVPALADAVTLSTNHDYTCATMRDGRVRCFDNRFEHVVEVVR